MKNFLLAIALLSIICTSCGDGNVIIQQDPAVQAALDSAKIVNYLADLGFEGDEIGTTDSGVKYVILEEGAGNKIGESDIVTFDYIGKLTNDTIFDTSIKAVADSIRTIVAADTVGKDDISAQQIILNNLSASRSYQPYTFTYSSTGWTLTSSGFIQGYIDGISATFNQMNVGGKSLIVIPSSQAYGQRGAGGLIGPNAVIAFELLPSIAIKQK